MSEAINKYVSEPQQKLLTVLKFLAGHEIKGVSPSEIAEQCKVSSSAVTRILANLQIAKIVEPLPSNQANYRLTVWFVQLSNTVSANFIQAQQMLEQDLRNFTRLS